ATATLLHPLDHGDNNFGGRAGSGHTTSKHAGQCADTLRIITEETIQEMLSC
ncbi:hypothetical protein K0M31_000162, partial [Melipona bicolor]